jgi:hypothetical protein
MAEADKSDPQGASPLPLIERGLFRARRQFVSKTHWDGRHIRNVWQSEWPALSIACHRFD